MFGLGSLAILPGVRWDLIMGLIPISLMTGDLYILIQIDIEEERGENIPMAILPLSLSLFVPKW